MIDEPLTVRAIDLEPGDQIIDEGTFPRSLYQGTVRNTVIVDNGVQINLEPPRSGCYTRPEDHLIDIRRPREEATV